MLKMIVTNKASKTVAAYLDGSGSPEGIFGYLKP